jgi:hypothetical protein
MRRVFIRGPSSPWEDADVGAECWDSLLLSLCIGCLAVELPYSTVLSRVGPNIFQVVWGMALASLLGGTVGTSWLPPWRRGIDTG